MRLNFILLSCNALEGTFYLKVSVGTNDSGRTPALFVIDVGLGKPSPVF